MEVQLAELWVHSLDFMYQNWKLGIDGWQQETLSLIGHPYGIVTLFMAVSARHIGVTKRLLAADTLFHQCLPMFITFPY